MNPWQNRPSLRAQLLGPLLVLLLGFSTLFGILAWRFKTDYATLSSRITAHSSIVRHVMEITRLRARTQETLLTYRLTGNSTYLPELDRLERSRRANLESLKAEAESQESLRKVASSLAAGIQEVPHLREMTIKSIREHDFTRADQALNQLSMIFEINSARLKDFSLRVENELVADETRLQSLMKAGLWGFGVSLFLLSSTIFLIAIVYRRGVLEPLQVLHQGLQSLTDGHLKTRIRERPAPLEIGEMVEDFNRMASSLEASQNQVRSALRLRDEFLSVASHELKTPLTSLRLKSQLYQRKLEKAGEAGLAPEEARKLVGLIDAQVSRLNVLVDEMLDISRISSGKLSLHKETLDLGDLARAVCDDLLPQLSAAGSIPVLALEPAKGRWDRQRLEQVMVNLLTNAMKYGNGKPIRVEAFQKGDKAFFVVRDQGLGIPKELQQRIFDQFERGNAASAIAGLGLGLYIVRKIVQAHHGKVLVESEPGKGARFIVELPLDADLQLPASSASGRAS